MSSRTHARNAYQSDLDGAISDSVTTITLTSTAGLSLPGYLVIDGDSATLREYIKYAGLSGNDLTGVTRGLAGSVSGGQSHIDTAPIASTFMHQYLEDIFTDIEALETEDQGWRQQVIFTANGFFSKATYPWLKRIRIRMVGGGGGGGGCALTAAAQAAAGAGGGGGAYIESKVEVAALAGAETVTIGAGGAGGAAGNNAGVAGTDTTMTPIGATADAGSGGAGGASTVAAANAGGVGGVQADSVGDIEIDGGAGDNARTYEGSVVQEGGGGPSQLSEQGAMAAVITGAAGSAGQLYGGGGGGGYNGPSEGGTRAGGAGAAGIIIVDLYAS